MALLTGACDPLASAVFPSTSWFSDSAPRGSEQTCAKVCVAQAARCSADDCTRGCNFVLDRLVEKEGEKVVECVARSTPRCDDRTWAACAARVGPHADGGPPAPALPASAEGSD